MSPKALVRASLALLALTAAACSETLAPKLERIQSQIANTLFCDVNWTGLAGDNQWQTPGNWAPPAVPTGAQNVCITGDVPTTVVVRLDAFARNITIGAPGNATKQALAIEGFFGFGARANLTVGETIDNYGELVMRGTGHFPAAPNLVAGTIHNRAGARMLASDVGFSGGITYWVNATVVNEGLLEFRYYMEMRGHWTNRGAAQMLAGFSYLLPNGAWIQESGSLAADGTFIITDGLFRLENGAVGGAFDGPIMERGTFTIADGSTATGKITLRNTVAMSGNVPADFTVIAAGHSYSTTGINYQTFVTAANGFANRGTIRLISTGHAFGQPSHFIVTNGAIDNHGRIESHVGNSDAGRVINANIVNRAGGVVELLSNTDFNKPGATYENNGTITTAASKFFTFTGAPSFMQNGALTLGANSQWRQDGGSFRFAGPITGRPWLAGIALDIPSGSPAAGTLLLTHTNSITGDVPAGVKLHIENFRFGTTGSAFDGILNASASYMNFGTIVLGNPGFQPNPARVVMLNGSTLTNKGRFETVYDPSGGHRYVVGNFTNEGTLQLDNWTQFLGGTVRSLAPAIVSMGPQGQGLIDLQPGATLIASGTWPVQLVNRGSLHIGAPGTAAQLHLTGPGYNSTSTSSVTIDIGGSPTAPGVDFDKLSMTGPMTIGGSVMHVKALSPCVDGGKSYDVIAYSHPSGNFGGFTGLDLGNGRTVQPEQLTNGYRLNVVGPVCPPPDATPPVITPTITGTLGDNGWYRSDVTVTWSVTDTESPVTAQTGCGASTLTNDHAGVTYTCTATSAGGTATQEVTVKRDATPPTSTFSRTVESNAAGWWRTPVTVTFTGSDAMSGLAGDAVVSTTVSTEGLHEIDQVFRDLAGNTLPTAAVVRLDMTPPTVTVTRSPLPDASGWNDTDVTATWNATDALSGIAGSSTATMLFDQDGANQSGSRTFSDLAGNSASATISDINIDKTPTPPPPPPPSTITPVCSVTPNEIWPPNNKMVAVRATVGGTGVTSFKLRSVTNNETGSADVSGWTIGTADVDGQVKATRLGGGSGRTYTLTYDVFGANGATGSCALAVRVPHDQRR